MTKTLGACISLAKHAPVTIVRQMMMIVNPLNTKKYVAVFFVIAPYCIVFVANEFVRKPVQHTRRRRRCKETNVAAIDEDFVAEVCFSLKQYRDMPIELLDDISVVFAGTVEYTQEVFELLMSSMRDVDGHLNFWSKRQKTLNARQQFIFLIFRRYAFLQSRILHFLASGIFIEVVFFSSIYFVFQQGSNKLRKRRFIAHWIETG